jgi:hypothetical protein
LGDDIVRLFDRVDFRRDVLPRLQSLPVRVIAAAMDANISHGSKVRNGRIVLQKRHWNTVMQMLGGGERP